MSKKRITKVYTRTGDAGMTSLVGGDRISKASSRVDAYGDVDELNSVLGIAYPQVKDENLRSLILAIQNDLFIIGADLASPEELDVPRIEQNRIDDLEHSIDGLLQQLEPLKEFILPGGSAGGASLHLARAVSRRAERKIVALKEAGGAVNNVLKYMNRLSDLLFVMARFENKLCENTETYVDFSK